MFIVNEFFLPFLYFLYLSLHQKHQKKVLVCENPLGNKSDSDSDSEKDTEYLQKIYTRPAEEFERVNLQIVQGQAPTKISLQKKRVD